MKIVCPSCGYKPAATELYKMGRRFSIQQRIYELECPQCHSPFDVDYDEYYEQMEVKEK